MIFPGIPTELSIMHVASLVYVTYAHGLLNEITVVHCIVLNQLFLCLLGQLDKYSMLIGN